MSEVFYCLILNCWRSEQKNPEGMSIDDVLTTSNGTTFYILVEPGRHGLLETPDSVRSLATCATFLTDTQGTISTNYFMYDMCGSRARARGLCSSDHPRGETEKFNNCVY